MRAVVVIFPGSNRERDVCAALARATGHEPLRVWHRDAALPAGDLIVLPGGFTYGDYLRCGAIAAHSPIMRDVRDRAANGTPGSYTVTAAVGTASAQFSLTNNGPPCSGGGNLALGRPAAQSSTLPGTPPPGVAVDCLGFDAVYFQNNEGTRKVPVVNVIGEVEQSPSAKGPTR